jgi:hypothetical protein
MEILLPYLVGVGLALGYVLSAIPRRRIPGVKRMRGMRSSVSKQASSH